MEATQKLSGCQDFEKHHNFSWQQKVKLLSLHRYNVINLLLGRERYYRVGNRDVNVYVDIDILLGLFLWRVLTNIAMQDHVTWVVWDLIMQNYEIHKSFGLMLRKIRSHLCRGETWRKHCIKDIFTEQSYRIKWKRDDIMSYLN